MSQETEKRRDPCEKLIRTMQEQAAQKVYIEKADQFSEGIHNDVQEIKDVVNRNQITIIERFSKMDLKLLAVVISSFLGGAYGDKIIPGAKAALQVAISIVTGDAYAGQ